MVSNSHLSRDSSRSWFFCHNKQIPRQRHNYVITVTSYFLSSSLFTDILNIETLQDAAAHAWKQLYRGADKSLARTGRKQVTANKV